MISEAIPAGVVSIISEAIRKHHIGSYIISETIQHRKLYNIGSYTISEAIPAGVSYAQTCRICSYLCLQLVAVPPLLPPRAPPLFHRTLTGALASVFVLLYEQLRQHLYFCTSQPGPCAPPQIFRSASAIATVTPSIPDAAREPIYRV